VQHISTHYNSEKQTKSDSVKSIAAEITHKKAGSKIIETEISRIEKTWPKTKRRRRAVLEHWKRNYPCGGIRTPLSNTKEELKRLKNVWRVKILLYLTRNDESDFG